MPELWALVSYFEENEGSGEINCKKFIHQFLATGINLTALNQLTNSIDVCMLMLHQLQLLGHAERDRHTRDWRAKQREKEEELAEREEVKRMLEEKRVYQEVDFDFNEEEFDETLYKIISLGKSSISIVYIIVYINYSLTLIHRYSAGHRLDKRQLGAAGLSAFECESLNPAEFRELLKRTFNLKVR